MQPHSPTQAAEQLLIQYAEALNAANPALLPALYTTDGVFMPDGVTSLPAGTLPGKGENFFAKTRFHISYAVEDVTVGGEYAFVQATARTATTDLATGQQVARTSREFFVLRQESQDWKIYRYLFNSVRER
ncbi:nuclear transport factor 2 family protein [Hymenobacter sp. M29]|uniref:Nuclear transport factor 2 family protein n=1 Tax=Hymenobacter mellowenesis TaxID=3063995 RepID=A0ABT9AFH1_9BACT|nr:nuclear transport factor 2 family protein [Hymenobacter sp. M29]MDO7848610.1 nuclear transport factor 2 family protein [Hymenobacter sp. M29]